MFQSYYAFGGGGEIRTPVQNTFLVASNNHITIIHHIFLQNNFIFSVVPKPDQRLEHKAFRPQESLQ